MNLKLDQKRYRVFLDESYGEEKEPGKMADLWRYYELRGKYGILYAYSETHLVALVTSSRIAEKVKKAHLWPIIQNGGTETAFKLENNHFRDAAQHIQARKRRVGNPENGLRLAKYRFRSK
ncbi:MAG TPA: hypothetical protein VIY47_08200 [Ignavibacteriaceae bacterium]